MTGECGDCGAPPRHPGSVVRVVGTNHSGDEMELCSKCFIRRARDAATPSQPKLKKGRRP